MAPLIIKHLSPSAIREYMTNRQSFFLKYVRLVFEQKTGPSLHEGTAFHRALELYWKDRKKKSAELIGESDWAYYLDQGLATLAAACAQEKIDWGKEGCIGDSEDVVRNLVQNYRTDIPELTSEEVEFSITTKFDHPGIGEDRMLKIKLDLLASDTSRGAHPRDHKSVKELSSDELELRPPQYDIQAGATYFALKSFYGKAPEKMVFDEVLKGTPNPAKGLKKPDLIALCEENGIEVDKKATCEILIEVLLARDILKRPPVTKHYEIKFVNEDGEFDQCVPLFLEIYSRIVNELSGGGPFDPKTNTFKFIPNPFQSFGGEDAWKDFKEEVLTDRKWTAEEVDMARKMAYGGGSVVQLDD